MLTMQTFARNGALFRSARKPDEALRSLPFIQGASRSRAGRRRAGISI